GSLQNHAFMKHWHNFQAERLDNIAVTASTTGMDNIAGTGVNLNTLVKDAVTDGVTGAPLTSTETRMTNASFDCYIVY
ncbi:MAG: hypothetical protein PHS33_08190, partial [Candidatus Omnitrophica bacterium]|nr:hypothetical protein [Candidatus Omnitrophota bacterium]